MKYLKYLTGYLLLSFCFQVNAADPVKLPSVNLGNTSFLDGVAGPGTLVLISATRISADQFNDNNGDALPGSNNIDVSVLLTQYAKITKKKIWGAYYGWEVLLPLVDIKPDTSFTNLPNRGSRGTGDLIVSPFMLQWTDSTLFGKRYFHRLNLIFTLPTGNYNSSRDVNTGSNTYRFNPYYAGTLFINDKWASSFRMHYLWDGKNNSPTGPFDSTQAGNAFHINLAASYQFTPKWRVGLSGYYLKQTTEDRINGISQEDSKEQAFGLGPGLFFKHNKTSCTLNSYFEFQVENRPEAYRFLAKCSHVFP